MFIGLLDKLAKFFYNTLMDPISKFKEQSEKTIAYLVEELKSFRTGKASPAMIENIEVNAYDEKSFFRLKELAAITNLDVQTLVVKPFDPSIIANIEKALLKTSLGVSPQTQGTEIIVKFPPLTQEQREKLIKFLNQIIEEKRVQLRRFRDEARKVIKIQFEEKKISEDERYRLEKMLDEETKKFMERIEEIRKKKETEIKTL